jgi:hypothetical protein
VENLSEHGERAASLLELRQRPPLALKHRRRRRVERITGLELAAQEIARLRIEALSTAIPLGRQARGPLDVPIRIAVAPGSPSLRDPSSLRGQTLYRQPHAALCGFINQSAQH